MPRIFEIVSLVNHPDTGTLILDKPRIDQTLQTHKTIKEYAYILHDKDAYTAEDESKQRNALAQTWEDNRLNMIEAKDDYIRNHLTHISGAIKPAHWHIVIHFDRAQDVETISKWFGVPANMIDIPKGQGAFLDKVEYITHEHEKQQAEGKYLYPDSDVIANFSFRDAINNRRSMLLKYGKKANSLSDGDILQLHVMQDGWSLRRCRQEDPLAYIKVRSKLPCLRLDYLQDAPPPPLRLTIYVDGPGGIGKSSFCRAIAENLFKDYDSPYFSIGNDERVSFDGYDGEPCIIWNDMRAWDFISRFQANGAYKIFDTHPDKEAQQAKNTRVILTNVLNIINGVQPYEEFISALAGTYTDKNGQLHKAEDETQAWRRFPMILCVRENDFDILLNKGFIDKDLSAVQTMIRYNRIRGSFKKVMERLDGEAKDIVVGKMVQPVVDAYQYVEGAHNDKITTIANISNEFKDYGQLQTEDDIFEEQLESHIDEMINEYLSILEYSEYLELFYSVHAESFLKGKIKLREVPDFDSWQYYGCPNFYDESLNRFIHVDFNRGQGETA